jgi:hypothetical protein
MINLLGHVGVLDLLIMAVEESVPLLHSNTPLFTIPKFGPDDINFNIRSLPSFDSHRSHELGMTSLHRYLASSLVKSGWSCPYTSTFPCQSSRL